MKIHLSRTKGFESSTLRKVWELLVLQDGPMKFYTIDYPILFEKEEFEWDDLFTCSKDCRSQNKIPDDDILITLTELSNNRNWFSAPAEDGSNNIFIHSKGWENFIYSDSIYPIAYEVIANVLQRLLFKNAFDLEHAHEPAIGCMNDMCSWKPDITFKLRTGDICQDCLQWAKDSGIVDEMITQAISIFSLTRRKMLFSSSIQMQNEFDSHLPFNVAITKRKISSTSEPLRKFLFLIDHFDSLIRTAVIFWSTLNFSEEQRKSFFIEQKLTQKPSLGIWLLALQNLTKQFQTSTLQLNSAINKKIKNLISIADQGGIVSIRNEMRGHGYIECNDVGYKSVFNDFLPIISQIEDLLNPLFTTNKLRYINYSSLVGAGEIEISSLELAGSYAVYTERQNKVITSNLVDVPVGKHVCIYNVQQEKWFDLIPFFIFENCPACKHHRLLVYDSDGHYLDPLEGHRVTLLI
jgi:hypothetical protein